MMSYRRKDYLIPAEEIENLPLDDEASTSQAHGLTDVTFKPAENPYFQQSRGDSDSEEELLSSGAKAMATGQPNPSLLSRITGKKSKDYALIPGGQNSADNDSSPPGPAYRRRPSESRPPDPSVTEIDEYENEFEYRFNLTAKNQGQNHIRYPDSRLFHHVRFVKGSFMLQLRAPRWSFAIVLTFIILMTAAAIIGSIATLANSTRDNSCTLQKAIYASSPEAIDKTVWNSIRLFLPLNTHLGPTGIRRGDVDVEATSTHVHIHDNCPTLQACVTSTCILTKPIQSAYFKGSLPGDAKITLSNPERNPAPLDVKRHFTITAYIGNLTNQIGTIIDWQPPKSDRDLSRGAFCLDLRANNRQIWGRFSPRNASSTGDDEVVCDLEDVTTQRNGWYWVGYTYNYDTGDQKIWVDGKECISKTGKKKVEAETNGPFVTIGAKDTGNVKESFQGNIACVTLFNRALNGEELLAAKAICLRESSI